MPTGASTLPHHVDSCVTVLLLPVILSSGRPQGFEADEFAFYALARSGSSRPSTRAPTLLAGRPRLLNATAGVPTRVTVFPAAATQFAISYAPADARCGDGAELRLLDPSGAHVAKGLAYAQSAAELLITATAMPADDPDAPPRAYTAVLTYLPRPSAPSRCAALLTYLPRGAPLLLADGLPAAARLTAGAEQPYSLMLPAAMYDMTLALTPTAGEADLYMAGRSSELEGMLRDVVHVAYDSPVMQGCNGASGGSATGPCVLRGRVRAHSDAQFLLTATCAEMCAKMCIRETAHPFPPSSVCDSVCNSA